MADTCMSLLSSPLSTLPTVESTAVTIFFRDFGYAAECLRIGLPLSQFVLSPRLLCASVSRDKSLGAREVGLSRFANLCWFCMRRSIRDIAVFGLHDTRGRTQGRNLGVSGGTCRCGGSFCRANVYDLLPCLRSTS